ncbi:MAG TPA: choice-of-anchor Q domain-containing protein, partial [Candidatus Deferrimicrobium sp.]|nr:choice-of-anchor Q domain-containing protein [Candidatus Deferrimicrobium sp.]
IYGRGGGNMETTPWSAIVINTEQYNSTFEFVNVAVDDYIGQNYLMHVQYDTPLIPINLTIKNTIFCARGLNTGIFIASMVHLVLDYNLFYMPNHSNNIIEVGSTVYDSTQLGALGIGNIYSDPRFVHPAVGSAGDYHLQIGSAAIDNGTVTGAPLTDLDGAPRPHGTGYDLGVYEYILPGGDTIMPTVIITSPSNGTTLASSTAMVIGTAGDNIGVQKVEISKDGINWIFCTGTKLWFGNLILSEGSNLIYVKVTDTSGNSTTTNITVIFRTEKCEGGIPSFKMNSLFTAVVLALVLFQFYTKRKQKKGISIWFFH